MSDPIKILVVEDDVDSAELLRSIIEQSGYASARTVGSVRAARALLGLDGEPGPAGFAAVLLDVGLPDGDGIELCRAVRSRDALRQLPVLMVTARDDEDSLEAAFVAGASDYICKPVRSREVLARVRAAISRERRRGEPADREPRPAAARVVARASHELFRLSTVDALTGLANRRHFNAAFRLEWRRAARSSRSIALCIADLDWFGQYNQQYGHAAGDECLQKVAAALADIGRRPPDLIARLGGEEIGWLLTDCDAATATVVAERMRAVVAALALPHPASSHGRVTVSVGHASTVPRADLSPESLLTTADEALLEAKRLGRNRIHGSGAPALSVVEVDAIIMKRIPSFLNNRRTDVQALTDYARDGAFELADRLGHRLKGTGPSFGFAVIGEMGTRIQAAAVRQDREDLRRCAAELAAYLDVVQVVQRSRPER